MLPLISIIVPFHNVEKYLERSLDSIVGQTYENLEIILVNDGSTDNSLEICERYAKYDDRIKIVNIEHGGVSAARNAGLDAVTGEYIGFVDSDDYIVEDMYMELYNALNQNNCDMATCNFYRVYGDDYLVDYNSPEEVVILNTKEAVKSVLLEKEMKVYLWTRLCSKKVFDNIRFPEGRDYEDADVSIKVLENVDSIIFLNKFFYYYINRDDSIDNNYDKKNVKDSMEIGYLRYKYVKENYSDLLLYNVASMISRLYYTYTGAEESELLKDYNMLDDYKDIIEELNNDVKLFNEEDVIFEVSQIIEDGIMIWEKYKDIIKLLDSDNK